MSKFGLYIKSQQESKMHVNICSMPTMSQAEAYFAGVKRLSLDEFRKLFVVKEIQEDKNHILYENQ